MVINIKNKIIDFKKQWSSEYKRGEYQKFWLHLLNCLGIENPTRFIDFEQEIKPYHIDAYIKTTHTIIAQKSSNINLDDKEYQSDGVCITPFEQALRYNNTLKYREKAKWIVISNFREIRVHDMDHDDPENHFEVILLKDIDKEYYRLNFLIDPKDIFIKKQEEVSVKAAVLIGKLYDLLLKKCDITDEHTLQDLNQFCVRLVFLLYADDAEILCFKNQFFNYVKTFNANQISDALQNLFLVLATPINQRKNLKNIKNPDLLAFPHIDGGLFSKNQLGDIPLFDQEMFDLLVHEASDEFNWSGISPTIFGDVFESTLNPETRRHRGMHYTSIKNIHKVIDPLFLNDLYEKLDDIKSIKSFRTKKKAIRDFLKEIGDLTFFDPACGSGNFLTEAYISLRKIENEALNILSDGQKYLVKSLNVTLDNFYGIEINDFAVSVAKTALLIAESQMIKDMEDIAHSDLKFLPIRFYPHIIKGNALRLDWKEILPINKCNYIFGNPPFAGARIMDKSKKDDLKFVFGNTWKNLGNLDYVTGWYKKSLDYIDNKDIDIAFVSTNSITQGENIDNLWRQLFDRYKFNIFFAHRSFLWNSELTNIAHVYCVIIGITNKNNVKKFIFDENSKYLAKNINPYLQDADNVFIKNIPVPICDVPEIKNGNQLLDWNNYLFKKDEMLDFIEKEPKSKKYFKLFYGSEEFIHNNPRYCLWLGECSPTEIQLMPLVYERVENVRTLRQNSNRLSTQRIANNPTHFYLENMPEGKYLVIPQTSSGTREYIPIGFLDDKSICSQKLLLMANPTLYHFAILTSSVHMIWMRTVGGRLGTSYSYSIGIVYNNFPWPEKPKDVRKIESLAQIIIDIRNKYSDSSLADLYDTVLMPKDLREAHQTLDKAILKLYKLKNNSSDDDVLKKLFSMYNVIISNKNDLDDK